MKHIQTSIKTFLQLFEEKHIIFSNISTRWKYEYSYVKHDWIFLTNHSKKFSFRLEICNNT